MTKKGKRIVVEPSNNTKQKDVDQAVGIHFQEEILMQILSRLPVRSLLRFKCVSKFWRTLISQPYFTMKHLNQAKDDENSQKFLISEWFYTDYLFSIYCCSLSAKEVRELDFPLDYKPGRCIIHCCCDGLVLIEVSRKLSDEHPALLLWNPSTSESVVLPSPNFPLKGSATLGLGYDSSSGDYKILKVHNDKHGGPKVPSEILALKGGSWRKIERYPSGICNVLSGMDSLAFLHGAFHWIGKLENYSVVSFNISNEVYGEIPLPIGWTDNYTANVDVSVLKGMLCFCSASVGDVMLWVMKEYGVQESWNPLFTIEYPGISSAVPKYMFADDDVVFWCLHIAYVGNFSITSKGPFELWPQSDGNQDGFAYTESLISPKLLCT